MPFTTDQFLNIFKEYNTTIFPMQILFNILACFIIAMIFFRVHSRSRIINVILSFLWMWTGVVYHIMFFTSINNAAYVFGSLFIIQSLLLLFLGVIRSDLRYDYREDWIGKIGWILVVYSLLIYPALGYLFGHSYPHQPTFGLPCPTTIFTFGIFLFISSEVRISVYIVPVLWSLLGFSAAINMGIFEDLGLVSASLISISILIFHRKTNRVILNNVK